MNILNTILNIIFPVNCLSCGENGEYLCTSCILDAPPSLRESDEWMFPIYDYRHPPIKKSIHFLKYKEKKILAKTFAEIMYPRILEELADLRVMQNFYAPILIPIPLSKKRYKERGYNQSELICKNLVKLDKEISFKLEKDVLIKNKETKHQAHIKDRKERLENLKGSFSINTENTDKIKNKNIILIDDVFTTGATLNEAKKILKKFGARKIIAFTIAH